MNALSESRTTFDQDLSAPEAIPEEAIARATELMQSGRLFRYGEDRGGDNEAACLEQEFAEYLGVNYVVGVNSGGCALFLALKSVGVQPGDTVLLNAFTLAPVPGAIVHAGAQPLLVEVKDDLTIDIADLRNKAETSGAKVLMLSHMRGHIADMDALVQLCKEFEITMIEDCAHTIGADWNGQASGTFGMVSCFSSQTFKHLNSGEGGLVATNDADIAAKAILHSGSYMLYAQHSARPPLEVIERHRMHTPNFSMRMSNLVASLLRPQVKLLEDRRQRWNERYTMLASLLNTVPHITVPARDQREGFVGSSLQFLVKGLDAEQIHRFTEISDTHGVHVKWFGRREPIGFTSRYSTWNYIHDNAELAATDTVLDGLCDMRIPLSLTMDDCRTVAKVLQESIQAVS